MRERKEMKGKRLRVVVVLFMTSCMYMYRLYSRRERRKEMVYDDDELVKRGHVTRGKQY